jgi:23S rRNA pseudouridine1911/1915/1917 synthase
MLHAAALGFTHPLSGEKMELNAPLPADFMDALNFLKTH